MIEQLAFMIGEWSVRLRRAHPRARELCCGFRPLLANSPIEVVLG
ncbi:MAG TPA: hypothetical protein VF844_22085 [Ktedonobacteraceae bacterium]